MRPILICDTECYRNYWLIKFYDPSLEGVQCCKFELFEGTQLNREGIYDILSKYTIITFNGLNYDLPIITYAMTGANCSQLKDASDLIIKGNLKWWEFYKHFKLESLRYIDHIDICDVLKGVGVSLKKYGSRLHCKKLQDLPVHESAILTSEQMALIDHPYCTNDLTTTYEAYLTCKAAIDLRTQMSELYGIDLRSKSDAQMAEAIIKVKLGFKPERAVWPTGSVINYVPPEFIDRSPIVDIIKNARFTISDTGIDIPEEIKTLIITIGVTKYQMGIGGLHSMEESVNYKECDEYSITDADVTSYYPSLMLLCGMFPKQLGERFLDIYREVYDERLKAKKSGDKLTAECFKIILNGTYGKLGSKYSILYAPDLMLKVTLTGQLSILMLIQMLEDSNIKVISANTDGIVMLCPRGHEYIRDSIMALWVAKTGLNLEYTDYKALYSRDVNNYVAIKPDGDVKLKGVFAKPSMEKDPHNHISIQAAINYLNDGSPIENTVRECTDLKEFITVRYCKGGAIHVGRKDIPDHTSKEELVTMADFWKTRAVNKVRYVKGSDTKEYTLTAAYKLACEDLSLGERSEVLGKVVRFYMAEGERGYLAYSTTGNKIADSQGAKPLMDLPDTLPKDINYNYYVEEAKKYLTSLSISVE